MGNNQSNKFKEASDELFKRAYTSGYNFINSSVIGYANNLKNVLANDQNDFLYCNEFLGYFLGSLSFLNKYDIELNENLMGVINNTVQAIKDKNKSLEEKKKDGFDFSKCDVNTLLRFGLMESSEFKFYQPKDGDLNHDEPGRVKKIKIIKKQ